MKHGTPDTMKFKKLVRRLGVSRALAVGTLELLWIATQKNAKRGDIGRFSNEEIAIECDWSGDPDELVAALLETGWIDRSEEHRLVVHNWAQHAPRYLHAWVKGQKTTFAAGDTTVLTTEGTVDPTAGETTEGGIPNLTKPNLTEPNVCAPAQPSAKPGKRFQPPTVEQVEAYCQERNNAVDANRFVDYYTAQGWHLANGRKMVDWKAALRGTWEKKTASPAKLDPDPRGNITLLNGMIERGEFDESA